MNTLIRQPDVPKFFDQLLKRHTIIGPVKRGEYVTFDEISEYKDLDFSQQTDYPAKKHFLPSKEDLLTYRRGKAEVKAATYHGLRVSRADGLWTATVVLDV